MGVLFNNIEDVNIKGGPFELSDIVSRMDRCMQDMADRTNQLANVFNRLSGTLKGKQFESAAENVSLLSKFLQKQVENMNIMQRDVTDYQNRLARFEGISEEASCNEINITPVQTSAETTSLKFTEEQWRQIYRGLCCYSSGIVESIAKLQHDKNEAGEIWRDSQYNKFSDFIDETVSEISNGIKLFEEYTQYLKEDLAGLGMNM